MLNRVRFPIRFKFLIALLLVITAVVGTITFTMAKLFHDDKSAYIHDLTSEMAMHTAAETRALLVGYRQRLQVFTRLLFDRQMPPEQKSKLLKQLFEDFQEFVAITVYEQETEQTTVYDAKALEAAGLTKDRLMAHRSKHPLPFDSIEKGAVFAANSTISSKLPTFTLAVSNQIQNSDSRNVVVAAVIRSHGLQRLATRSKVFTTFIVNRRGKTLAHTNLQKVVRHKRVGWIAKMKHLGGKQSHGATLEFILNEKEMVGGVAGIEVSDLFAGVQIPKAAAYLTARELLNNLMIVSLALLIIAAILSLLGSRLITRPLERLAKATKAVAKGRFDIQVALSGRDEIGNLAQSFNKMTLELDSREKALKDAQAALIQSEKLAAFGQLGAGIAHEVKNPLAGILGLTQLSLRKAEKDTPVHENLAIIEKEATRCATIIQNLLKFARQEKVAFESVDLNQVAKDAMAIVEHQLEMNKVKLRTNFTPDLPTIAGNANQIQQVLINLMINAQQAMEGHPGEVTVTTASSNASHVQVQVKDDGPGIPEDIQAKIFEPFFTTKEVGKGTGLGLSVSYGIIKEHKGDIQVESSPETGTKFNITFPAAGTRTVCPKCKQTYPIRKGQVGLKNKCKKCGAIFKITQQL